jgi:hypothetical protein
VSYYDRYVNPDPVAPEQPQSSKFQLGDILCINAHKSRMHPSNATNPNVISIDTLLGAVVPALRLIVILHLYEFANTGIALELHSFQQQGIRSIPEEERRDYISLADSKDPRVYHYSHGEHSKITVFCDAGQTMHPKSVIHLLGLQNFSFTEDVFKVGRLPEEGYKKLLWTFENRTGRARKATYNDIVEVYEFEKTPSLPLAASTDSSAPPQSVHGIQIGDDNRMRGSSAAQKNVLGVVNK